jgi:hypothetical protein
LSISREVCDLVGLDPDKVIDPEEMQNKIIDKMKESLSLLNTKGDC